MLGMFAGTPHQTKLIPRLVRDVHYKELKKTGYFASLPGLCSTSLTCLSSSAILFSFSAIQEPGCAI